MVKELIEVKAFTIEGKMMTLHFINEVNGYMFTKEMGLEIFSVRYVPFTEDIMEIMDGDDEI